MAKAMSTARSVLGSFGSCSLRWRIQMDKFEVEIYRDGKWWMANIPALDLLTQARRLSAIEDAARDAIAVTLDVPNSAFDMNVKLLPIGELDVDAIRCEIDRAHAEAEALEREASTKSKELTRNLARAGVPVRDIGTIIGLSHQRAHQLVHEGSGTGDAGGN